jgi:3-oxoacyl-[acyl-carrier protein] reductase
MSSRPATDAVTAVVAGATGFAAALVETMDHRRDRPVVSVAAADDRAAVTTALEAVADLASVVHVCDDPSPTTSPLASTDAAAWEAGCERVVWRALTTLQAAHAALAQRDGGRIVVITATAGVSGAPGAVPLVAAVEGVRALAKSAARQWGALGISVNCVSVPLDLLAPALAGTTAFLPPPALARPDPVDDVAAAVKLLCGPGADGISGATLLVDGGAVMAP